MPSISIVTVCYNSSATIERTVKSVIAQTYNNFEYLIVDGASKDNTVALVESLLKNSKVKYRIISEPDKGIYDAMSKGIANAKNEVVAVLNSDDRSETPTSLEDMANAFTDDVETVLADVMIADGENLERDRRFYSAKNFKSSDLLRGIMPGHAGFYTRRSLFTKLGAYKADYRLAGDFELMLRFFLCYPLKFKYFPSVIVRMSDGGASSRDWSNRFKLNREIIRALSENGFPSGWLRILTKIPGKLMQYFQRPEKIRVKL